MTTISCRECSRPNSEFNAVCIGCGANLPVRSLGESDAAACLPERAPSKPTLEFPPIYQDGLIANRFQITETLGQGGMGTVHKARDQKLERWIALKSFALEKRDQPRNKRLLIREAQVASALNHPNIVTTYDLVSHGERDFIAMEYVEGQTLRERIGDGLPLKDVFIFAEQITGALAAAHAVGVIHRDIKPANIMITHQNQVRILDFGLARIKKVTDTSQQSKGSFSNAFGGTIHYMSPEQARGERVGTRSDIFSFGILLFKMLTGEHPFHGSNAAALLHEICYGCPKHLPLKWGIPGEKLSAIIRKALEKKPAQRFQTMSRIHEALLSVREADQGLERRKREYALSSPGEHRLRVAETRKQPRVGIRRYAIGLLSMLLLAWTVPWTTVPATSSDIALFEPHQTRRLAVLPFINIEADPRGEMACEGLVETITTRLTQLEVHGGPLWLVPTSEIRLSKIQTPSEALQQFNAELVISGSLQRLGENFRFTLRLVDTRNLRQLRAETIDLPPDKWRSSQDYISGVVIGLLAEVIDLGSARRLDSSQEKEPDPISSFVN